jgi:D-tyrosyl-tRNA(Tyr) deacylase
MAARDYLIVLSEPDAVARAVAERWPTRAATGFVVDGAPVRGPATGPWTLRRPAPHLSDDELERRFPAGFRPSALVFPSVHRSAKNIRCVTVHPLGNPIASATFGGRPATLVPTAPRRCADALRRLDEIVRPLGTFATYEATHHGPFLTVPAFFAEVSIESDRPPEPELVDALARVLPELDEDPSDRVAIGLGGGHYVPHLTDLARKRRWAFGHLFSRHVAEALTDDLVGQAWAGTLGAEGWVCASAAERARLRSVRNAGPVLAETAAPLREGSGRKPPTGASSAPSGT